MSLIIAEKADFATVDALAKLDKTLAELFGENELQEREPLDKSTFEKNAKRNLNQFSARIFQKLTEPIADSLGKPRSIIKVFASLLTRTYFRDMRR